LSAIAHGNDNTEQVLSGTFLLYLSASLPPLGIRDKLVRVVILFENQGEKSKWLTNLFVKKSK
jgi:hypothetical protein